MIARWTFDDGAGSTAVDSVGGHTGTLEGDASWVTTGAKVGSGAISFDGSGDGIRIPNAPSLQPSSITVMAWVRGAHWASGGVRSIIEKGARDCDGASWGMRVYDNTESGAAGFIIRQAVPPPLYWTAFESPSARLWDGGWHHLVFSRDETAGSGHVAIDGLPYPALDRPFLYGLPTVQDLIFGRAAVQCPGVADFAGQLDDVRIYDRALSAAEIAAFVPEVATTTTLDVGPSPMVIGTDRTVAAAVTPPPPTSGTVNVYRVNGGAHQLVGVGFTSVATGIAEVSLGGVPVGANQLIAEFEGAGRSLPSVSPVKTLQVVLNPLTMSLSADRTAVAVKQPVQLQALLSRDTTGPVTFTDTPAGGTPVVLGTAPVQWYLPQYRANLTVPELSLGSHSIVASVPSTETISGAVSTPLTIVVGRRPTSVGVSPYGTAEVNHPYSIHVSLTAEDPRESAVAATGTLTLRDGATIIGVKPIFEGSVSFDVASFSAGVHQLYGEYSGDGTYAPSVGIPLSITIAPDRVEATGVGVQYTTFYPYKDKYRDTVAITGLRAEPISVTAAIYSPTGSKIKTFSAARATGSYSFVWTGRSSSGAILPAGKYKVVQTLVDAAGTKKAVTSYVVLSTKRIYSYSVTLEKTVAQASFKTSSAVGWQFTLPAATVYTKLTLSVYGRSNIPPISFGGWDTRRCPFSSFWDSECLGAIKSIGTTAGWTSLALNPTYYRSGRYVRGLAFADYGSGYVSKARVAVVYGILK